mgnify:FL=1
MALRLVRPVEPAAAQPVQPAQPVSETQAISRVQRESDAISFEQAYRAELPRPALTEAHARLERIRNLVGAKVNQPMHFEEAVSVQEPSNNPYAISYPKISASPAELNARAIETTA